MFQRTANFSVPAHNGPIDEAYKQKLLKDYPAFRKVARESAGGFVRAPAEKSALEVSAEERDHEYQVRWDIGGFAIGGAFIDLAINPEANETAAEFVRNKIRANGERPGHRRIALPEGLPLRDQAPLRRHRVLRDLQPRQREAGGCEEQPG